MTDRCERQAPRHAPAPLPASRCRAGRSCPSNSIASAASRLSRCASAKVGGHGGHVEHASAVDPQHAVRHPRGAGMEDGDAGRQLARESGWRRPARAGPDTRARRAPSSPTPGRSGGRSGPRPRPCATVQNASVSPPSTSGSTTCVSGSPEPAVELHHPRRSVAIDHQAGIQHAGERACPRRRISSSAGSRTSRARASRSAGVATATGLYAPMPPVLGPASPSSRRL